MELFYDIIPPLKRSMRIYWKVKKPTCLFIPEGNANYNNKIVT